MIIYTVADLADRWKVSEGHVRKQIANRAIASFRVGCGKHANIRITDEAVRRYEGAEHGDGEQRALAAVEELRRAVRH